jgi:hypothetical protein
MPGGKGYASALPDGRVFAVPGGWTFESLTRANRERGSISRDILLPEFTQADGLADIIQRSSDLFSQMRTRFRAHS